MARIGEIDSMGDMREKIEYMKSRRLRTVERRANAGIESSATTVIGVNRDSERPHSRRGRCHYGKRSGVTSAAGSLEETVTTQERVSKPPSPR
jgi:methylmalonyl-CoA mutase N-terminal domain/subunit